MNTIPSDIDLALEEADLMYANAGNKLSGNAALCGVLCFPVFCIWFILTLTVALAGIWLPVEWILEALLWILLIIVVCLGLVALGFLAKIPGARAQHRKFHRDTKTECVAKQTAEKGARNITTRY